MSLMFGKIGAERLISLATEVRKHYVKRIEERYHLQGLVYSPWMGLDVFLEKGEIGSLLFETYARPSISLRPEGLRKLKVLKTFRKQEGTVIVDALAEWDILDPSDPQTVERTNAQFQAAYQQLTAASEYFAAVFPQLIDLVLPLNETLEFERGSSNHHIKGVILLAARRGGFDDFKLAISMAHELGHQCLMHYQTADSIIADGQKKIPVYSGVRKTMRPAMQAYHAIAALAFMIYACDELLGSKLDSDTAGFLRSKRTEFCQSMKASIFDLKAKCDFTDLGRYILQEFEGTMRA